MIAPVLLDGLSKTISLATDRESFKFQTLDDAIKLPRPNYFMAKIDLRHAYRSVPIHKSNYSATGLQWQFSGQPDPTYFYDTQLPFGAKSSPEIFHRLTQSVWRMMARRGFETDVVYLDDFLVIVQGRMSRGLLRTFKAAPGPGFPHQLVQSHWPHTEACVPWSRIGYPPLRNGTPTQ